MDQTLTASSEIKTTNDAARDYAKLSLLKKEIEARLADYREKLLNATKELGVLSLKTAEYTITRVVSESPKVIDFDKAVMALRANNVPVPTELVIDPKKMDLLVEFLRDAGMDDYIIEKPIKEYVETTAAQLVKEGTQVDGTIITGSEYIRVTPAKKDAKSQ